MRAYQAPNSDQYLAKQFDPYFGHQIVEDVSHSWIHAGRHFFCSDSVDLGLGATYKWAIRVPASPAPHALISVTGEAAFAFELSEGATGVTGGSAVNVFNNNRRSSRVPGTTVVGGVSTSADGTLLYSNTFGSPGKGGGTVRNDEEIILAEGDYILFVDAVAAGVITMTLAYYEPVFETRADSGPVGT